jgi:hypothetical protein
VLGITVRNFVDPTNARDNCKSYVLGIFLQILIDAGVIFFLSFFFSFCSLCYLPSLVLILFFVVCLVKLDQKCCTELSFGFWD